MAWMHCPKCGSFLEDRQHTAPRYYCECGWNNVVIPTIIDNTGWYVPLKNLEVTE